MKNTKLFCFIAILLISTSSAFAQTQEVINGLHYLNSAQNPDGSWGDANSSTEVIPSTVSVIEAMREWGETSSQNYIDAFTWLQSQNLQTTDYLSERIHTLSDAGTDMDALLSYLDRLITDAWGGYEDHEANNLDTSLALLALNKSDYSDLDTVSYAFAYLIDNQNADGGFGFYIGDDSNTFITSILLKTFALYNGVFDFQDEVNDTAAYLLAKQNSDGGFGLSTSTVYETALAFMALTESGQGQAQPLHDAIDYLQVNQLADGSWNDDPYETALALQSFANVKADLSISFSDITFSDTSPTAGESITITTTIHNQSLAQADNVSVRFYDGNPEITGILIGEEIIAAIAPYGSYQTGVDWTVMTPGTHVIYVTVDPDNIIPELDETDNNALNYLTSAALADLSVSSVDISFTPVVPDPDEPVTITINVRNLGETSSDNIYIDVYNGDPASGGKYIGSAVVPSIGPGSTEAAHVMGSFPAGNHNMFVVIDSANNIVEGNESNNIASRILQVGTTAGDGIDLSIYSGNIIFNPTYPVEGDIVIINASIHNTGEVDSSDVLAQFYLGDPDSGGSRIDSDISIPSVSAGGSVTITASLDTTGIPGSNNIFVRVDPNNLISEIIELNNSAYKTMKVAVQSGTDLMVSNGEITFSPVSPKSGDIVTITAAIRNLSYITASNVLVEFSDGDPNVVGSMIIGSVLIPSISTSFYYPGIAEITFDTTGLSGTHDIYVNIDPFNEIVEMDEKDNIAGAPLVIAPPQKPDITVISIDTSNLVTDTDMNEVSGSVNVGVENIGIQDTISPFAITLFENSDDDEDFNAGTDNVLGHVTYSDNIEAGGTGTIDVALSGNVLFRDNLIYAFVDSGEEMDELDEGNNIKNTGEHCETVKPECDDFDVVEKFAWDGNGLDHKYMSVYSIPLVANLTDDNGDNKIDLSDIPDIIFQHLGKITAISGDDGTEHFSVFNGYSAYDIAHHAVGDIDGDGLVEIASLSMQWGPLIKVLENDGTLKWISDPIYVPSSRTYYDRWGVSISDLDADGIPELISGPNVLNNDGTVRWSVPSMDGMPAIADLDMDGLQEIVIGNSAYRHDGTLYWTSSDIDDTFLGHAIANLDDDPYPEIVQVMSFAQTDMGVAVMEHDGTLKWGPVRLGSSGFPATPTIADFDGDGEPEIGVSTRFRYVVFEADGSIKWQSVVYDGTFGGVSAAAFDFDGDGAVELVHNDMQHLRIYNGRNGEILFSTPNSTGTYYDSPSVVDVDNDGNAEIIVNANFGYTFDFRGVRVFENVCDRWENTRKIWNEYNYHITNVNDDGTIPQFEQKNWEVQNNYRENLVLPGEGDTPDITTSLITIDQSDYPDSVTIFSRIGNGGASDIPAGTAVTFYDGDPLTGGVFIGTANISQTLNKGSFEDVSIVWDLPPSGVHDIYVVADDGNNINECREDNNTAFISFDLGSGVQLPMPDIIVSLPDLSNIVEGQTLDLTAIVNNIGDVDAVNVTVSFYDGNPDNGGILIDSVTGLNVDVNTNAPAEVSWNTMGQSGVNFIYVKADPQEEIDESNEGNNTTLVQVEVTQPVKPDITAEAGDLIFFPENPEEGDSLTLAVTVRNNGTDADKVKVDLYDGVLLIDTYTISQIIPFGSQEQVVFNIDTVGIPGSHTYNIALDPDNIIDEENEANNSLSADILINSIGLGLMAHTDKTGYNENEDVLIIANISDLLGSTRDLLIDAGIYDASGTLAASVPFQAITVNPLETGILTLTWNTGAVLAGDYSIKVTVYDMDLTPLANQSTPITIASSEGLSANITLDKISYSPNENAEITSTIINNSVNTIFENITSVIIVKDQSGQTLYTENRTFTVIAPSALLSFKTYWNTGINTAGEYSIKIELKDGIDVLLSVTKNISINSTTDPSVLLAGEISVDMRSLLQGDPVGINYSVINTGNIDLTHVDLSILTVHVVELTVYDTLTDQATILIGETYNGAQQLDTQSYTAKDYLVILRANIEGEEASLASAYFRVEGAPSTPSLNWPIHGEDIETPLPEIIVNNVSDPNDDSLTYDFELYTDSGLITRIASESDIAEGENISSWVVPVELNENSVYFWRARAFDGMLYGDWMLAAAFRVNVENDAPTAPTLSGPANGSEVDTFTPVITISNASDPDSVDLIYNFEVSMDYEFTSIVTSEYGVTAGDGTTSWQVPVVLEENTTYYWHAQADDWLIEGPWMETASFLVNTANDAPTTPYIVMPLDGSEILELNSDVAATGAIDPDLDPLFYWFETDTVITFDSAGLITSGDVPEGLEQTVWNAAGLLDNTTYYMRVNANDNQIYSPWSNIVSIFVNTLNDPPGTPVQANPSDGGAVNLFNPVLSVYNSTDIDGDILTYDYEIYSDETMTDVVADVEGIEETLQNTSWIVPVALEENATYSWRARAFDGDSRSDWTALTSFMVNTANDAPSAPELYGPVEGNSLETLTPMLSVINSLDPDNDVITYDFEIYIETTLVDSFSGIPEDSSGITSVTVSSPLTDNTSYSWRARAYDGDRYGAWMDLGTFSIYIPVNSIAATIDFRPRTLNRKSNGRWVVVYIELPQGHDVRDIDRSSILLEGSIPARPSPYHIGDHDRDGIEDLMVKFQRSDVIDILPEGYDVQVTVTGNAGATAFEGVDTIRAIPDFRWRQKPPLKRCKSNYHWKLPKIFK